MTEQEWLTATDSTRMLEFMLDNGDEEAVSERKLRLFSIACCERLPPSVLTPWLVIEFNALASAMWQAEGQSKLTFADVPDGYCCVYAIEVAVESSRRANNGCGDQPAQAKLVRDIFGNPFRSISVDWEWLTSDVIALAKGIYEERAFDRMPILADALQDAGCNNADILDHCRGSGPHVRGCWVVDMLLGKS